MAYSVTVSSPMKHAERISRSLGMFIGKLNIDSYNSTLVEITGITKYFVDIGHTGDQAIKYPKGVISCTPTGPSDNGHVFTWDATNGAFKCWKPTSLLMDATIGASKVLQVDSAGGTGTEFHCTSATGSVYATAAEAADNCDVGEIGFVAVGLIR